MGLSDLLEAYGQGLVMEKLGPDWIEKLKKLKIANAMSGLEAQNLAEAGKGAAVTRKRGELSLSQEEADQRALLELGVTSPKAAEFLRKEAEAKRAAEAHEQGLKAGELGLTKGQRELDTMASPEEAKRARAAAAAENEAQAQYYRSGGSRGGGGGRGTGITLTTPEGGTVRWFPNTGEVVEAPEGLKGTVDARLDRSQAKLGSTLNILIGETENLLTRYEKSLTGLGRILPTKDRVVAGDAYKSMLGSMAQLFGRKVLEDQRVSDQDRRVYTQALGVANELIATLDPTEARRRLVFLKQILGTLSPEEMGEGGAAGAGGVDATGGMGVGTLGLPLPPR